MKEPWLRDKPWRIGDHPAPLPHLVVLKDEEDPEDHRVLTYAVLLAAVALVLLAWLLYPPGTW